MVSGSLDTSIRVWDAETGACKHTLMGHQSLTSGMELRNNILVSGNADSTVKVWDIISGKCLQTLSGEPSFGSPPSTSSFSSVFNADGYIFPLFRGQQTLVGRDVSPVQQQVRHHVLGRRHRQTLGRQNR